MQSSERQTRMRFCSGLSASAETSRAAEMVSEHCGHVLGGRADVAFVFFTAHHCEFASVIAQTVQKRLNPGVLIGVSAGAVIGDGTELEGSPGVSLLCARLPGARATGFSVLDFPIPDETEESRAALAQAAGYGPDQRCTILLADPFSTPLVRLLPAMNAARPPGVTSGIFGGLASAATQPNGNVMLLNDQVLTSGGVGVTLGGDFEVDSLVSQGCRPFGPNLVVTKAQRNIIFELGGRPALEAVSEAVGALSDEEREGLKGGLFIGRVTSEYKERFGRDDFLIRSVTGVDHNRGAIAVGELMHVGQTIRLHMRDARTAHEDLALLLDAQRLYETPRGVLLFSCNARGRRLFDQPNHDAGMISRAFLPGPPGESLAKPGAEIDPTAGPMVPLAGFFASSEIGPLDGQSYVHGNTACAAIFRETGTDSE